MSERRVRRLNSLLKEVISDVIRKEMKNPQLSNLITVTHVTITKDLSYAKVYVSVIGKAEDKNKTIDLLQSASGFIGMHASKQVVIRYFPTLTFILDDSIDQQMHIDQLLSDIRAEQKSRRHE